MPSARRSETGLDMFRCSSLRWKTGLRAARATRGLTSAGRLKAIRKPMPTYAGTKNLNLRAPLELKTAEGHLWRGIDPRQRRRSEEHTSELQSLMRNSYSVFCLKKKTKLKHNTRSNTTIRLI